jgi:hypothetical protein
MKAVVANQARLTKPPVGWNDRVWLCFKAEAGLVLTR